MVAVALAAGAACGADGQARDTTPETTSAVASSQVTKPPGVADATSEPAVGSATATTAAESSTADTFDIIDIGGDAASANVIDSGQGDAIVGWTTSEAVWIARLDVDSGTLSSPTNVSGAVTPMAHPIERPALVVDGDGRLHVAYTTAEGTVQHVVVVDDDASEPATISGPPRPETVLVHAGLLDGRPVYAWLEDSTLSVAATAPDDQIVEQEAVDDLTCDCCNPVPLAIGDRLVVTYRDRIEVDGRIVRDATIVTTDGDGGSFSEPTAIADDHWFVDACPFSGPSVVDADGTLVVAWMDGRQSVHPDQDGTTIWVDRSTDGGDTFGTDLALTNDGIHRWPVMASIGTVVHLVWEVQANDGGGIAHVASSDRGESFGDTRMLVTNSPEAGAARTPSIAILDNALVVTWVDRDGAHALVRPFA